MSELRLVPAALTVWAVTLALLIDAPFPLLILIPLLLAVLRQYGQALLTLTLGGLAGILTAWRQHLAATWHPPEQAVGTVVTAGRAHIQIALPGHLTPLTVFNDSDPNPGAHVLVQAGWAESDRPGVGTLVGTGEVTVVADPSGLHLVAASVRDHLRAAVDAHLGESSRGLVPGMVLGDVGAQSELEQQLYIDTGLSHLSAVSGANVAVITTAAVVACRLLTLGPRVQVAAAVLALLGFVGLVGTEPSVLRASVTGLVGLLAVLGSTRLEPIHGLCLAVIGLILWDSGMAVSYGFALSVAATAGIIALHPLLVRPLARTGLPEIVVRALAVAISADIVTLPIIALMAGEVSVVSVLANVLVAPAVAPVTVLGLIAAGLSLLPGPIAWLPLKLLEPCTWWIHTVAEWCASLPVSTVPAEPLWVLIAYGWIIAGIVAGHPAKTLILLLVWWIYAADFTRTPPEIPLDTLQVHVVREVADVDTAPPGTQVIIVSESSGSPADRPTVTRDGIPVLFPNRDGEVTLHADGTQHARDGRF
ncbi:MAG: ComEC/Rec2 family competence protein [Corynebacterium sp.]|uniref:ComEC/Rec2 family competence protein n=1 Tax=Corynebacterium sp. TaxID=1720 RepID=UPI0026DF8803|nr:ComEC/Rec2 family competence protein [Corynebacterium sp.]MDO5668687.1 ComEC/Rec2 family competence protein [Corynebacterium sp.]